VCISDNEIGPGSCINRREAIFIFTKKIKKENQTDREVVDVFCQLLIFYFTSKQIRVYNCTISRYEFNLLACLCVSFMVVVVVIGIILRLYF
jgi:hypothetical protein